jgi:hypothetical protein
MNMRKLSVLGTVVVSGLLTLGACGSSSSSSNGGTTGAMGGTTGAQGGTTGAAGGMTGTAGGHVGSNGGGTGTGVGGASGKCADIATCLEFIDTCGSAGTCMSQTIDSVATGTETYNECYSNGVKNSTVSSYDVASGAVSVVTTVSKNGSICYTLGIASSGAGGATGSGAALTFKNAAGAVLATISSPDAATTVVSCGGKTYTVGKTDCEMPSMPDTTQADCTDGVCP